MNRDRQIEQFGDAAEAPTSPAPTPPPTPTRRRAPVVELKPWRRRANSANKSHGYNFRYNPSQYSLLDYAAQVEETSKQKLIERLVWQALEDQYGDQVPFE